MSFITDINAIIESPYTYLIQHVVYLAQIKAGRISDSDISDYMTDVFNIKVDSQTFKKDYLSSIEETLTYRLDFLKKIKQAVKLTNHDKAIFLVKYLLDIELVYSQQYKFISNSLDVRTIDKIQAAFNDTASLTAINSLVTRYLPTSFEQLAQVIKIKENTSKKKSGRHKKHLDISSSVDLDINWNRLVCDIKLRLTDMLFQAKFNDKYNDLIEFSVNDQEQQQTHSIMYEITQEISSINTYNKNYKNESIINKDSYNIILDKNIDYFLRIIPLFNTLNQIFQTITHRNNSLIYLHPLYKNFLVTIKKSHQSLTKDYQQLLLASKSTASNNNDTIDLSLIEQQKSQLDSYISTTLTTKITSFDDFEMLEKQFHQQVHALSESLQLNHERITNQQLVIQGEKENDNSVINHHDSQEIIEHFNKETMNFRAQLKQKNDDYKKQVNAARKEKQLAKQVQPHQTSSSTSTGYSLFCANPVMQDLLMHLNDKKLDFLQSILELSTTVKYEKIKHFITNHLHGKIIEIGNGSSHKRIELYTSSCNMINHSDERQVDTIVKPHGHAHNSGKLSQFNLRVLKSLFERTGITLGVLADIKQSKNNNQNTLMV